MKLFGFALGAFLSLNCRSTPPKKTEPPPAPMVIAETVPVPAERAMPVENEMQVAVIGDLALRASPGRKSEFILAIPYGATVQIIDQFGPDDLARGVEGRWYKIRYRDKTGWSFGGFLRAPGEKHRYRIRGQRAIRLG